VIVALGRWGLAPLTTGPLELTLAVVSEVVVFLAVVAALDETTRAELRGLLARAWPRR
jgi:hypothetical protein